MAVLYGARAGSASTSDLYTIDPATGAATAVGPIGYAVTGLAMDPTTGTLYGATSNNSGASPRAIITIDTSTGAGTLVGPLGLGPFGVSSDICFDASGQLYGWSENTDDLIAIDKGTGAATIVGDAGLSTFGDGMDFDAAGVLYVLLGGDADFVYTVDPTTGIPTQGAALSGSPFGTFDAAVSAASFTTDKATFYAVLHKGGTNVPHLATIDLGTGVITDIATLLAAPPLDAICWAGPAVPPDPDRPTITGFTPTSGTVHTRITITGTKFTGATDVKVHGTAAAFTVDSDTQITTSVPVGASVGAGSLSVTTPHGTAAASIFTVVAGRPNDNDFTAVFSDEYELHACPATVNVYDTNFGATKQAGEPNFNGTAGGHSVWWWFTSNGNGNVTITVAPDSINGTPLSSPLLLVYDADNADFNTPTAQGTGSVTFAAKQDTDYAIGIDGAGGQEGDFILTLTHPVRPANDDYATAQLLAGNSGSTTGTTNWACTDPLDPGAHGVWYQWTPSVSGWARVRQTLTDALNNGARVVEVYAPGAGLGTPVVQKRTPSTDVAAGSPWSVYFEATAGTTYHIFVGGYKRDGVGQDRYTLEWLAPVDVSDATPGDVVVGPGVSSTSITLNEPTPAGQWFRFEIEWVSGALPTHAGTLPGHFGLLEFLDDAGTVVAQLRLAGDILQARSGNDDSGGGGWSNLGKPATLGPGLAKVRVEFHFRYRDDTGNLQGRIRVNGLSAGPVLGATPNRYIKTLRRGCLWNGGGDNVQVRLKNIGIRTDPALGPWYSTDTDDKGVTFMYGAEGGELGVSNGGTSWIAPSAFSPAVPPAIIPAPGVGASPVGRYGNAIDCTTTVGHVRAVSIGGFLFDPLSALSFYFALSSLPEAGRVQAFMALGLGDDGDSGSNTWALFLDSDGNLLAHVGAFYNPTTVRLVSVGRWHHVEVLADGLRNGYPLRLRLNGQDFGPYTTPTLTTPFVPNTLRLGTVYFGAGASLGIAVKDITVYRRTAYPLGGQTIRKRVPDGVGVHDANVDEWVGGVNQQVPITQGDARFDYSGYAAGSHDPPDWFHNLRFADTVAPDDPSKKLLVDVAGHAPPAAVAGQKTLHYKVNQPTLQAGAYVLLPPPSMTGFNTHAYLIEAWIYKEAGATGQFDSWAGFVALQGWPWSDVIASSYGGWFRHSRERFEIGNVDQFGFNHGNANLGHEYEMGPITIWQDFVYEPRATGFWQSNDDGATYTSIQNNDTTSYQQINEWPPATGGAVIGIGPATRGWEGTLSPAGNSSHHLEYTMQDNSGLAVPILAARLYARGRGYQWQNRGVNAVDASTIYPSRVGNETSGTPLLVGQQVSGAGRRWLPPLVLSRGAQPAGVWGHDAHMLPTDPNDAAWTAAAWNDMRIRWGFATTALPTASVAEPVLEAMAIELLVPEAELPPEGVPDLQYAVELKVVRRRG